MSRLKRRALLVLGILIIVFFSYSSYQAYRYINSDYIMHSYFTHTLLEKVKYELFGDKDKVELPLIKIEIDSENLKILNADIDDKLTREKSYKGKKVIVNGAVSFEGNNYDSEIRIRGDEPVNYNQGLKNASLAFKTEEKSIWGNKKFSLLKPRHEFFFYGVLYYDIMAQKGLISNDTKFVRVELNGEDIGLFLFQQKFDFNFLDLAQKDSSIILKFDNDCMNSDVILLEKYPTLTCYQEKKILKTPLYSNYYKKVIQNYALLKQNKIAIDQFVAIDEWAKFIALSDIFTAHHSNYCHNVRMYYNPKTGLLEPIAWDPRSYGVFEAPKEGTTVEIFGSALKENTPIYRFLKEDRNFLSSYIKHLKVFLKEPFEASFQEKNIDLINEVEGALLHDWLFVAYQQGGVKRVKIYLESLFKAESLLDVNYYLVDKQLTFSSKSDLPIVLEQVILNVNDTIAFDKLIFPDKIYTISKEALSYSEAIKSISLRSHILSEDRVLQDEARIFKF